MLENRLDRPERRFILGNVLIYILTPCRTLDLDALSDKVQRKHCCFGENAGEHASCCVAAAPGHVKAVEGDAEGFVGCKEDAHEGYDLS